MSPLAVTTPQMARLGDLKAGLPRFATISAGPVLALSIVLGGRFSPISTCGQVAPYLDPNILTNLD